MSKARQACLKNAVRCSVCNSTHLITQTEVLKWNTLKTFEMLYSIKCLKCGVSNPGRLSIAECVENWNYHCNYKLFDCQMERRSESPKLDFDKVILKSSPTLAANINASRIRLSYTVLDSWFGDDTERLETWKRFIHEEYYNNYIGATNE